MNTIALGLSTTAGEEELLLQGRKHFDGSIRDRTLWRKSIYHLEQNRVEWGKQLSHDSCARQRRREGWSTKNLTL